MKFTKEHSLNEILKYPEMEAYLKVFYSEFLLEMIPEELREKPLYEVDRLAKPPWEGPFSEITEQLLYAVGLILDIREGGERTCIPLWNPESGPWHLKEGIRQTKEDVFLVAPTEGKGKGRPCVIICPGGGYTDVCFSGEGTPVMERMEAAGYGAFILKYRVAPARYPDPQKDLVLAVKYVRANAEKYGIDKDRLLIMGFSAGGHLCALTAAEYEKIECLLQEELRQTNPALADHYKHITKGPEQICLSYPVISFEQEPHEGSFQALTGEDESLRGPLSVEKRVTAAFPKTFLWTCADDDTVPPSNTEHMAAALKACGVPHEVHIYPTGGHGCALAQSKSAAEWSQRMLAYMSEE